MSHPPPDLACPLQWTTAPAAGTDQPRAWTGPLTTAATGEWTLARSITIIQENKQISMTAILTCSYLPSQSSAEGQSPVPDLIDMFSLALLHAHRTKAVPHPSTAIQGLIVQALL